MRKPLVSSLAALLTVPLCPFAHDVGWGLLVFQVSADSVPSMVDEP